MIVGTVSADGVPTITLSVAGQDWPAVIDTGFNGDLEQIANGFTKTESGSCFDKLSTNGWILGVAVKTVHPEPVEG